MNFRGGGASCNPAPVRVLFKFTLLGRFRSFFGDLFSLNSSLARYRFENKYSKNLVARERNNNVKSPSALTSSYEKNSSLFTAHRSPKMTLSPNPSTQGIQARTSSLSLRWLALYPKGRGESAFTLAEVLITLGIIGLVAAMTLPTLIGKVNDFILKQQFKKAYSTIMNAHNRVFAEYGSYPQCYYIKDSTNSASLTMECEQYWEMMKKFLNPSSICDDNAYSRNCIPKYKGLENVTIENNSNLTEDELAEKLENQKRNCGSWFESRIDNGRAWVLKDGTIMLFTGLAEKNNGLIMAVDVNGNKRPNKWGYDIFHFILRGDYTYSAIEPMGNGCVFVEKGGKTASKMLQEVYRK